VIVLSSAHGFQRHQVVARETPRRMKRRSEAREKRR
jgi:hypothetical protein